MGWTDRKSIPNLTDQTSDFSSFSFQYWSQKTASVTFSKLGFAQKCAIQTLKNWTFSPAFDLSPIRMQTYSWGMLAHLYIEALLVDPDLADEVWELWDRRAVSDQAASIAWWLVARGIEVTKSPD